MRGPLPSGWNAVQKLGLEADGSFFKPHEHGWIISDPVRASALILANRSG